MAAAPGGAPRGVRADDEVLVDLALAKAHDISTDDEITLAGQSFSVVGISEDTSMWVAGLMFFSKSAVGEARS